MKKKFSIFFYYIFINTFSKIVCQVSSKNFVAKLNFSSEDNIYYTQLNLDEMKSSKKFFLDTTFPLISYYCDNLTYKENCEKDNECFVNSKLL